MKNLAKGFKRKAAAVTLGLYGSVAMAAPDLSSEIAAAETSTTSNVTLAVAAFLAVGIISFGVGAIYKWISR